MASGYGAVDKVTKAGDSMTGKLTLTASTPLQVTTTAPAVGKVLVSDSTGNVSWGTVSTAGVSAPLALSSGQAASSILSVTNTTAAPSVEALQVTSQAVGDANVGVLVAGDANRRLSVDSTGKMLWGPGSAPGDTNLYRSAANTLKTDNNLAVGGTLTLSGEPASALQAASKQYTDRIAPSVWNLFGHSYFNWINGTVWTSGRTDSQFRMMVNAPLGGWRNFAVLGSKLIQDGWAQGGWVRVMQELTHVIPSGQNIHGAPYWSDFGATVLCYGVNDAGGITTTQANIQAAYQQTLRAVIARARTSVAWKDNYTPVSGTVGQPVYGAGFTTTSGVTDKSSGSTLHTATATTNATITLTLPADYNGEPVVIQWVANAGTVGGTVTYSGTAGVTGTTSTSNIIPASVGTNAVPVVKRITNLTSANAGQTIVCTVTALDASGSVQFDYWGLESKTPPPVIVCNAARLPAAGYTGNGYPNTFGDADVTNLNTAIASVVAEFDGQVVVADIDSALNKDTTLFASDALHPNEIGAGRAAVAITQAVRRLAPSNPGTPNSNLAPSAPIAMGLRCPRFAGSYYTAGFASVATGASLTVGDMYAIPFPVTEDREEYSRIAIVLTALGTTASSIRWGVYDDRAYKGYPQCLWNEATSSGAFSLATTGANLKEQTGILWSLEVGLWWIVAKLTVAGTGQTFETMSGPDATGVMPRVGATVGVGSLTANTTPIAWKLTGQGTGVLPSVFPSGASVSGSTPKVGLLKV